MTKKRQVKIIMNNGTEVTNRDDGMTVTKVKEKINNCIKNGEDFVLLNNETLITISQITAICMEEEQ